MRRSPLLVAGPAAAIVAAILATWLGVSRIDVGRSDFTSTYVGATLLREGHGADLYDESLQAPLHASLIAPDREGNLPFVNPPAAALVTLPLTWLDLATAYRLFAALQVAMLAAGIALAVRAAPGARSLPAGLRAALGLGAFAAVGTESLGLLGQWDGTVALGLGGAYALLRSGRPAAAGAAIAVGVGLAKPHLGLGIAAFLVVWGNRRLLAGALAGIVGLAVVTLLTGGLGALAGFAHIALGSTGRWPLASMLGFTGLTGSWLGDGAASQAIAAAMSIGAVAAAGALGAAVRRQPGSLEAGLAGAVALSLVASPHLLGHDLAVLGPVAAWCLVAAAAAEPLSGWPGPASLRVLALWACLNAAALLDLGNSAPAPPGRVVPLALAGLGAAAWTVCRAAQRQRSEAAGSGGEAPGRARSTA